jgi:hypothetical protein
MLRDLCAETGKQVLLDTSGETTEVDKGVIEKIGEPLTHLIRNAVDVMEDAPVRDLGIAVATIDNEHVRITGPVRIDIVDANGYGDSAVLEADIQPYDPDKA